MFYKICTMRHMGYTYMSDGKKKTKAKTNQKTKQKNKNKKPKQKT